MTEGARELPVHHLTIRVPWHDSGWRGTFCSNPCGNTSCMILPRIATGREDKFETEHAGESIEGLSKEQLPPCVNEHGTIMAAFAQNRNGLSRINFIGVELITSMNSLLTCRALSDFQISQS